MAKIRIFSTPACPYCVTLKEFLRENNFSFEDIDVSQDKNSLDEMIEKSGQFGVPVVDIDGQIVVGFNREKISKLLNINE
ncbi:MAG: NrdH-redoxin [Candidatus Nealsonbacteria bacterium]|nr:NrdH-redoxin [Candidatus Nealsonbacteria bacterium]